MDLTPKKIVESTSRCFICSSASHKNNKIFIYGKSSLNISDIEALRDDPNNGCEGDYTTASGI